VILGLTFGLGNALAQSNYIESADIHYLSCGDVVAKGSTVHVETLVIDCFTTILMQDNSVLTIGQVIFEPRAEADWTDEIFRVRYGDVGWDGDRPTDESLITKLPRTDRFDYQWEDERLVSDVNPKIVFLTCMPTGYWGDQYVDVEYTEYCEIVLNDEEYVVSEEDELSLDCVIYDMKGAELYRGVFGGIFTGDCGYDCLNEEFYNQVLLIRFFTDAGIPISVKRIYLK